MCVLRKRCYRLLLATGLLLVVGVVAATENSVAIVTSLQQVLIANMQNGKQLGFSGRRDRLTAVVDRSFDFARIARVAMGPSWQKMTSAQQARARQFMRALTIGSYAENFSDYSGESFRFVSSQDGRRGQQSVRTELVRSDDSPVQFDYILSKQGEQWRIINILASGVSDLSLKRAEYGSIIRKQGIVELLQQIDAQIKRLYPDL